MREIAAVELERMVSELSRKLEGCYLRKFYDLGNGSFRFVFYKKGSIMVYCRLLITFNETAYAEEAGEATPFAMGIRKRLDNARLHDLKQLNSDRIIEMTFEGYRLVIEMLGKGNMLLMDSTGRIILAYKRQEYAGRKLAVAETYKAPSARGRPISELNEDDVADIVARWHGSARLITYLSGEINMGPLYMEDAIRRSGIDPRASGRELQLETLKKEIMKEKERLMRGMPRAYMQNSRAVDYALCDIEKYRDMEKHEYSTLSELLDELYREGRVSVSEEAAELSEKMLEIRASIEKQERQVEAMRSNAETMKVAANRLFENMHAVNALIAYMREHRRATLEEARKAFADLNIKEINLSSKKIILEI